MILDEPTNPTSTEIGSTRKFLKKATVFWVVVLLAFLAIGTLGPVLVWVSYTR